MTQTAASEKTVSMNDILQQFTLVPTDYKDKDPRQLAFHYKSQIVQSERALITYNKYISKFLYYHSLQAAEQVAKTFGYILLPAECLHWRRATALSSRRVYVGRKSFYTLQPDEIQKTEKMKLLRFLRNEGLI